MPTSRKILYAVTMIAASTMLLGGDGSGERIGAIDECAEPAPAWIWCDDFERDRSPDYFEYDSARGSFVRVAGVGVDGSYGMRARFDSGQVGAGKLHLAFGRTPQRYFRPVDDGMRDYREVYWRLYLRNEESWVGGGGDKLSRATSFVAGDSWAQSMIAHVWSNRSPAEYLVIDPASGTDARGLVRTTRYNDFDRLRWLGARRGRTPLFRRTHLGQWYCIEARAALNRPGRSDGVFELWIDGDLEARREGLNWVGEFERFGINAVFVENYWNAGSPRRQERYIDNFVVSTERIGC